jgi:hypothetical protein
MSGTPQTNASLYNEITINLASSDNITAATLRGVLNDIVASGNIGTIASGLLLGNNTGNVAAPITLTPSNALDIIGSTQGSILARSGTGWTAVAPGTAGYILTTEGGAALPQWTAPPGVATIGTPGLVSPDGITTTVNGSGVISTFGGWSLLATITVSGTATATISDTTHLTNAYLQYKIVLLNIIPQTTQQPLQLLLHSGGAFKNTGYFSNIYWSVGGAFTQSASTTTYIPLNQNSANANNGAAAEPGICGEINIFNPSSGNICIVDGRTNWIISAGISIGMSVFEGCWNSASVIDGFQLAYGSGNISGTVKIYGIT